MCGVAVDSHDQGLALCIALGFHAILRTEEIYLVAASDLEFNTDHFTAVLTLPHSKSGTRFGMVESVVLDDALLVRKLHHWWRSALPGDKLYPGGPRLFRSAFDQLVETLHLSTSLLYKPYSLRRGAATAHFLQSNNMAQTMVRGRWANERTCRIYINEALTHLSEIRRSPLCKRRLQHYADVAETWFRS